MKLRLLESIRCPVCRASVRLEDPVLQRVDRPLEAALPPCRGFCPYPQLTRHARDCSACLGYEVIAGCLICFGCNRRFDLKEGVPRLVISDPLGISGAARRTASSYAYLWERSSALPSVRRPSPYHFEKLERRLSLLPPRGLVLDAGCGQGIDLANQAQREGIEIVGIELSAGGCRASFQTSWILPTAHVVQANICQLPFENESFDFIYSYGVLHHLASPREGLQELVRVLKSGRRLAVYLYEDFSDRRVGWRGLLDLVNQLRHMTTRLPHSLLYLLCQVGSPVVYLLFTVPFHLFRYVPGLRTLIAGLPFRHATGPFSLTGDLFDRFSTPIERRYSADEAAALLQEAGLQGVVIAHERGWMLAGVKPEQDMEGSLD